VRFGDDDGLCVGKDSFVPCARANLVTVRGPAEDHRFEQDGSIVAIETVSETEKNGRDMNGPNESFVDPVLLSRTLQKGAGLDGMSL
jgi:hypothetical protein